MSEDTSNKGDEVSGKKYEIKDGDSSQLLSDSDKVDTFAETACDSLLVTSNSTTEHIIKTIGIYQSPQEPHCAPCIYQQIHSISSAYCIECEELLCQNCADQHSLHVVNHRVIASSILKYCKICSKNDRQRKVDNICIDCETPLPLCIDCSSMHLSLKPSRGHTIQTLQIENSSTQVYDGSQNKTVNEDREHQIKSFDKGQPQEVDIKNKEQPGKPRLDNPNQRSIDSIKLIWDPPNLYYDAYCYQIRYKEEDSAEWKFDESHIRGENPKTTISKLRSNTTYLFQVRMINNEKEGPYSVPSDVIKTQEAAASRMLDFTVVSEDKEHPITIRKVPFTQIQAARNTEIKSRKLEIGMSSCKDMITTERTIMLVGATGSGKSTLVDGIANFVLGVNWDDNFRLTATDLEADEKSSHKNQAVSQTRWITCYTLHPMEGSRINYTLNIIDTPGFGDTGGIERDQEIIEQIRQLFHEQSWKGIAFVDAVCFLVKAPDARLTTSQRYIFDSILSLFGNDIQENICFLVTFADGNTPPVLQALKESNLLFEPYFPFNNSGLFANNAPDPVSLAPMFWQMGTKSFKAFFDHVERLHPKSLWLTKQVLDKRKELELTVENILPMIDIGIHKVDELSDEMRIFDNHQRDIEENRDFVYFVKQTKQIQIDLPKGEHVTNCLTCHMTCHKQCQIADDELKYNCHAMDKETGVCNQCDCHWSMHKNTPYIFEFKTESVKKTYAEKLKMYNLALSNKESHELVIINMQNELDEIKLDLQKRIKEVTQCTNRLKEIALRPNHLSRDQYIDLLIKTEKINKSEGFMSRVDVLLRLKKKSNVTKDYDIFESRYSRVQQSAKQYKNKESRLNQFKSVLTWKK